MSTARTNAMRQVAYALGMDFQTEDEWGMLSLLRDFRLFKRGRRKRITNMLRSSADKWNETQFYIFDYQYTVSTGKKTKKHTQSVFFVQSKLLGLPEFWMRPEHIFDKIAEYFGRQDIDFERFPEFSNQYLLRGEDEDYIRHTMNDRVLRYFTVEKNWSLEGIGYFLIFYKRDGILTPQHAKRFLTEGKKIFEMFKTEQL